MVDNFVYIGPGVIQAPNGELVPANTTFQATQEWIDNQPKNCVFERVEQATESGATPGPAPKRGRKKSV